MEIQVIKQKIYDVRGQKVMLDFDLTSLYEVEARALNQAVKRNIVRFPVDFMFQLTAVEWLPIRTALLDMNSSQFVTSYHKQRGVAYAPFSFTEQGVAMLSSVLRSEKAIQVNIAIMRAFVEFRRYALTYTELAQKIAEMEDKFEKEFADIHEVLKWFWAKKIRPGPMRSLCYKRKIRAQKHGKIVRASGSKKKRKTLPRTTKSIMELSPPKTTAPR